MYYLFIFVILLLAELAYFRLAGYYNIIDKPNERSSHTSITLRGGGVVFYMSMLLYFALEGFMYPWFFVGLSLITVVSFADDIRPQSNKLRLIIHFVSMGLMFYEWGLFDLPWYFSFFALIVSTGILNAYNFMDGINGITGVYSLAVAGVLAYINMFEQKFVDNDLIIIFILSLIVFNFFNCRSKAKCFAGDVGAISAAFVIVFLMGQLILKTSDFSYIVFLAVYGVDSILTIIHRMILKENIFEGHRKHAFQIMANELKIPHVLVSSFYALLQTLIFVGFFVFKIYSYWYLGVVCFLLTIAYLLFMMRFFKLHNK